MRLSIAYFHLPFFKGGTGPRIAGPRVERAHDCFLRAGRTWVMSAQQGTLEQNQEVVSVQPREG